MNQKHWELELDNDWKRLGFDPSELESPEIRVTEAERLSAEAALVVGLTAVGTKLLDMALDEAISRSLKKLVAFARSKEKRLVLELKDHRIDERVKVCMATIKGIDQSDFEDALRALPALRGKSDRLLASTDGEFFNEVWYEWLDGRWQFCYALTEGGETVRQDPS
jgi:hypothetical protein